MLGVIGFISAFFAILLFVASFRYAYPRLDRSVALSFTSAFMMLASIMAFAAIALLIDNPETLKSTIIAIDIVLLIATGFLLNILLPIKNPLILTLLAVVAGLAIAARVTSEPTAVISEGILYFNIEGSMRLIMMAGLFGVWFPASYIVARQAVKTVAAEQFHRIIELAYIMLTISAGIFFAARTQNMILASFGALVVTFVSITGFNVMLKRITDMMLSKKRRRHAR